MGKALAVDPGEVRIGIAISDETGTLARPLTILSHVSRAEDARRIRDLALETGAEVIVVGAALDSRGQVGAKARSAHRLVEALRSVSTLKIIPWDESHSTQIAAEYRILAGVKRKTRAKPIDALAAAVILQDYLDRRQTEDESA